MANERDHSPYPDGSDSLPSEHPHDNDDYRERQVNAWKTGSCKANGASIAEIASSNHLLRYCPSSQQAPNGPLSLRGNNAVEGSQAAGNTISNRQSCMGNSASTFLVEDRLVSDPSISSNLVNGYYSDGHLRHGYHEDYRVNGSSLPATIYLVNNVSASTTTAAATVLSSVEPFLSTQRITAINGSFNFEIRRLRRSSSLAVHTGDSSNEEDTDRT